MDNQFKPTHSGTPSEPQEDVRIRLVKTIWIFATAMMGISVPMVGLTRSPNLPICIIAAAAVGTVAACLGKSGSSSKTSNSAGVTPEQLSQIEERLTNVETISRFERSLHERDSMSGLGEIPPPAQERERPAARPSTPISY